MKVLKIINVDPVGCSVTIDWGNIILHHHIPAEIIENLDLTKKDILEIIERERPVDPDPIEIPKNLLDLVTSPSKKELGKQKRLERDWLIQDIRWRIERHNDEVQLGQEPTEPLEPILEYIKLLRDLPDLPDFPDVEFPTEP